MKSSKESPISTALAAAEKPAPTIPVTQHLAKWETVSLLKSDAEFANADTALGDVKGILAKIEQERKELTGPLHDVKSKLDKRARVIRAPFEKLEAHIKGLLAVWHDAKMKKQIAAAEKEAKAVMKESPQAAAEILALSTRANATPASNANFRTEVYGKLVDVSKLPRDLMLDETGNLLSVIQTKVNKIIRAGGTVPGVAREERTIVAGSASSEQYE